MKRKDFEWLTDEFMLYCRSAQLREKTMSSYEQTLHLFGRWLSDELKIYTVDKITENVIRKYIDDLMVRGKYTFYVNDLSKSKNCPDRRRDYRKPVSVTTINNYIRNIRVFFNWMEREYIIRKNPMKRIRQLKYNHQAENDWASDFLSKCLSCEPDLSASASELYSAYTTYCQGYRIPPLPQTKVMSRIHEHYGVTQKRNNKAIIYTGVGVSKPESLILWGPVQGSVGKKTRKKVGTIFCQRKFPLHTIHRVVAGYSQESATPPALRK